MLVWLVLTLCESMTVCRPQCWNLTVKIRAGTNCNCLTTGEWKTHYWANYLLKYWGGVSSSMYMVVFALGPATDCHILSSAWPMESPWQAGQSHTIHPSNWWSSWRSSNHNQPHWSAPFLCVSWPLIWLRKSPMAVCPSTTPVFIFCVRIRHPSGEVKWIEWIFWERARERCHSNIWWHFCFLISSRLFWDHLKFY